MDKNEAGHEVHTIKRAQAWAGDGTARRLRRAQGLSQEQVGAIVGVTRAAVCAWELRRRAPTGEAAVRYAEWIENGLADLSGAAG